MMEDSSYWYNSGLSLEDSVVVSNLIKSAPNFGMKLSEAISYYFGVPPEHCYQDKKFTLVNRINIRVCKLLTWLSLMGMFGKLYRISLFKFWSIVNGKYHLLLITILIISVICSINP